MTILRRSRLLAGSLSATLFLAACTGGSSDDGKDAAAGYDPNAAVELTWWTGQTSEAQTVAEGLAAEYHTAAPERHDQGLARRADHRRPAAEAVRRVRRRQLPGHLLRLRQLGRRARRQRQDAGPHRVRHRAGLRLERVPGRGPRRCHRGRQGDRLPGAGRQPGADLQQEAVRRGRPGLPRRTTGRWDDFRAAAKKLTDPAKNQYGTAYSVSGSEDTTWHLWPLLWQNGGEILRRRPSRRSTPTPASTALETLRAMAVDDKTIYLDQTDEKYGPLFNSGHVGMIITGPWPLLRPQGRRAAVRRGRPARHRRRPPDRLRARPLGAVRPRRRQPGRRRAGLHQVADQRGDRRQVEPRVGNLPLRTTEKDSPEFAAYVKEYPGGQKFFDNLANAKQARPTVAGYVELSRYVGDAIAKVLQGAAAAEGGTGRGRPASPPMPWCSDGADRSRRQAADAVAGCCRAATRTPRPRGPADR